MRNDIFGHLFWLGIVGYLLVIALPDKYARTKKVDTQYAVSTPTTAPESASHTLKASKTEQAPTSAPKKETTAAPQAAKLPCPNCAEDVAFMEFSEEDMKNGNAVCPFCNKLIKSN